MERDVQFTAVGLTVRWLYSYILASGHEMLGGFTHYREKIYGLSVTTWEYHWICQPYDDWRGICGILKNIYIYIYTYVCIYICTYEFVYIYIYIFNNGQLVLDIGWLGGGQGASIHISPPVEAMTWLSQPHDIFIDVHSDWDDFPNDFQCPDAQEWLCMDPCHGGCSGTQWDFCER